MSMSRSLIHTRRASKSSSKCLLVKLRPGDLERRRRGREGSESDVEEQLSYCCCRRSVRWAAQRRWGEARGGELRAWRSRRSYERQGAAVPGCIA
jgi:hypothetical protein